MARKKSSDKIRITLDMTPQFYERFEQLEQLVEAQSKASLIRQALQLYEYMAKKTMDGFTFQAIPPEDHSTPERIVFLGTSLPQ